MLLKMLPGTPDRMNRSLRHGGNSEPVLPVHGYVLLARKEEPPQEPSNPHPLRRDNVSHDGRGFVDGDPAQGPDPLEQVRLLARNERTPASAQRRVESSHSLQPVLPHGEVQPEEIPVRTDDRLISIVQPRQKQLTLLAEPHRRVRRKHQIAPAPHDRRVGVFLERRRHGRQPVRIRFDVVVNVGDDIPDRLFHRAVAGVTEPLVCLENVPKPGTPDMPVLFDNLLGFVAAVVVDHQNLVLQGGRTHHALETLQSHSELRRVVVRADGDADHSPISSTSLRTP